MSSSLGKRKEREDDGVQVHGSTLFVSNLPYTATSVDLQTLFSDIAPVRSAFVVLEPGTGVSKGVGYVSFAIKEDVQTVFDNISKEGLNLVGRKLRVQWAENKTKEKGETVRKEPKLHPPARAAQIRPRHDPLAIRTIIVSGLPSSIDSKALWKKIRKYEGAEKVDWPIKGDSGDDDPSTAHALFTSAAAAHEAVNKLHAHVFKGCLLSVTLKKRLDTLAKPVPKATPAYDNGGSTDIHNGTAATPSHASRLIVRNLPFNASEQDLRAVFLPYGPVYSIHIPTAERSGGVGKKQEEGLVDQKVRTKGFAFVWMLSKKDAEKAIEGCNGMVVRAGMADGMVSDKQKKKKQRRVEKKMTAVAVETQGGEEGGEKTMEVVDDKRATERVIAVDWALSKQKWTEEKAKTEEGDVDEDVHMEDADAASAEDSEDGSEDSDEDGDLGVHKGGDRSSDRDDSDNEINGDDAEDKPVKPQLPPPETGTTLFLRNVPFTATEDELRTLFRTFGPLRYTRITLDGATGRSRGTGFACFWSKEDADKVVEQSELLRMETTGSEAPKKNPFTLPSILTPDPSSTLAQSLVLHGRTLDVVRAVTRDEAGKLKEEGEKKREKADKRNMYLLREGVILPNSPAAETLTPAEIERRTRSYNARRTLLRSNPSLYISRTRLSVRQIPIFATERLIKRLSIHAVRAFDKEVKKGLRAGLTKDEMAEDEQPENDGVKEEMAADGKGKMKRSTGRRTGVKQAKIVRQQERVDPVTGKGRSKGYGFVEMQTHPDALRVLRWANNNPDVGPLFEEWWKDELEDLMKQEKQKEQKDDARLKRIKDELEKGGARKSKGSLIVEFSIENVQVVQRRNTHQKDKLPVEETKPREKLALEKAEERSPKKRRLSEDKPITVKATDEAVKPGQRIGSLIGRKRRERKGGKKSK